MNEEMILVPKRKLREILVFVEKIKKTLRGNGS